MKSPGRNGIGIKNALENRIIGTKSRGVYEAPGMELLGYCLEQIYQAILDKRSTHLFRTLSNLIATQIYDGRYFDPSTRAAKAAIHVFAEHASGTVTVGLYKGQYLFSIFAGMSRKYLQRSGFIHGSEYRSKSGEFTRVC